MATHRGLPVACVGQLELARDEVDDAVQDLVLVRDVVVQRHRLDPELPGEPPHAEGLDPLCVGEGEGGAEHPAPCSGIPILAAHSHASGVVLVRPDREVEEGSIVG